MGAFGTGLTAISAPVALGLSALLGCAPASDGIRDQRGGSNSSPGVLQTGGSGAGPLGQSNAGGATQTLEQLQSATGGTNLGSTDTTCPDAEAEKFTFFLTSNDGLVALAGNPDGFGGNLGGLEGADDKCRKLAEASTSAGCESRRTWRAFLSTSTVNAADRIGSGPWYDRRGRLVANGLTDLLADRPANADPAIKQDLPNEWGFPNHTPKGDGVQVDNHEILTGTGTDGKLYTQSTSKGSLRGSSTACGASGETWSVAAATCSDWTNNQAQGCPRVGHAWPRTDGLNSGTNWMSVINEGGCLPGGVLSDYNSSGQMVGGLDGTAKVGSAGGYGGYYCFAILK